MSIPSYLANIKSAGVYRYVFDKSIVPDSVNRDALRVMVGYSEKGPFNTLTYHDSAADFVDTYGNISRRMERKGIFFNRMCLQALDAGPILALNLKPFNADSTRPEMASIYAFNASDLGSDMPAHNKTSKALVASTSKGQRDAGIVSIYDTNRFWKVDAERLHDILMFTQDTFGNYSVPVTAAEGSKDYIRIVQTSDKTDSCTLFIRPFVPSGYDVKISDWYSNETSEEMPPYMEVIKDHFLNEFFAEVYVFKGDLRYKDLFRYTGTLGNNLPVQFIYARDEEDNPLYWDAEKTLPVLEKVVAYNENQELETFIVSQLDSDKNEGVKWGPSTTDKKTFKLNAADSDDKALTVPADITVYKWKVVIPSKTDVNKKVKAMDGQMYRPWIGWTKKYVDAKVELTKVPAGARMGDVVVGYKNKTTTSATGTNKCDLCAGVAFDPSQMIASTYAAETTIASTADEAYLSWQAFCRVGSIKKSDKEIKYVYSNPDYRNFYGELDDAIAAMSDVSTSNFVARYSGIMFPAFKDANGSFISLDNVFNADYMTHKMLMHMDEHLLDIALDYDLDYSGVYGDAAGEPGGLHTHTYNPMSGKSGNGNTEYAQPGVPVEETGKDDYDRVVYTNKVKAEHFSSPAGYVHALCSAVHDHVAQTNGTKGDKFADYTEIVWNPAGSAINGIYMEGYFYNSIIRSERGKQMQDKIFGVLAYRGIHEALTNNVDSDYHYLVDTFQTYPGFSMKAQFARIAKAKDNALAITNFPPMTDVITHCGHAKYDGGFQMKEIVNSANGISVPAETTGASWMAFYTQLLMTDGANKFVVPSAALVSNNYMEKYGKLLPYDIIAGPKRGLIKYPGVIGPDYTYDRNDCDILEPMGINAIISMPKIGTVINSNQTAKQKPVSALSKVHVRELVIFIQDEIENMLRGYQWDKNTAALREKIRAKADVILGLVMANDGIYAFRTKCDADNNPPEIIDNEMVVLDMEIEPARGAGKMVQTLTIHRTGGISSSPVA